VSISPSQSLTGSMLHNERSHLHRVVIDIQLQYTMGLKSTSSRLKGGELIN